MNAKENFSFLAEGLLPLGINLAVTEYALAPAARLDRTFPRCAAPCARSAEYGEKPAQKPKSEREGMKPIDDRGLVQPPLAGSGLQSQIACSTGMLVITSLALRPTPVRDPD